MSKTYLSNFFEEKQIEYSVFEITDSNGLVHFIDSDYVIHLIFVAPVTEQRVICQTLRKLDFYNKPIIDYLKYLAEVLVKKFNS